jgi:hypothetical protein
MREFTESDFNQPQPDVITSVKIYGDRDAVITVSDGSQRKMQNVEPNGITQLKAEAGVLTGAHITDFQHDAFNRTYRVEYTTSGQRQQRYLQFSY